jgi:hypothetical protein
MSEKEATKTVGVGPDDYERNQEARDHRAAHNRQRILRNDRGGGL